MLRIIRIAIVGPESCGKTTLAQALMGRVGGGLVPDGTRDHLGALDRPYDEADLLAMARSHAQRFGDAPLSAAGRRQATQGDGPPEPVIFDTDILNLMIWSREKFGHVHPEIERLVRELKYDLRLLCRPDIPWEPDPLREHPHDRDRLFAIWERELKAHGFPYVIIEGGREERVRKAADLVGAMMRGAGSSPALHR